jgi:hypothetical protein
MPQVGRALASQQQHNQQQQSPLHAMHLILAWQGGAMSPLQV